MTQDAWPFANRVAYEADWREMGRLWAPTGVLDESGAFVITQRAAGANLSVDIAAGNAWIVGHYFESDAVENLAVPAPAANPRIDVIVVELDFVANTRALVRHAGAEGAVPAAPALTQNRTTKYELPLFNIYCRVGMVSVKTVDDAANGYVSTDRRTLIDLTAPWGGSSFNPVANQAFS